MRDMHNNVDIAQSIVPTGNRTATVSGTGIDTANYDTAEVVFSSDTVTDGVHTPTIEESDVVGSGYTTFAAGDMIGTLAAITAGNVQKVGYIGKKRFVRAVVT